MDWRLEVIAYKIAIARDTATPATRALAEALAPARLAPVIGTAAAEATKKHFIELNRARPNALGGARTNYYTGAAEGTSWTPHDDGSVTISIRQIGLRLKYYGGTVTPGKNISAHSGKPTRFLTIPVNPKAHGRRASEFDLELVYNHNGEPVALATKRDFGVQIKQTVSKAGKTRTTQRAGRRGEIMFALVRSIKVRPDPSILPAPDRIYGAAISNLNAYVDRAIARAGS